MYAEHGFGSEPVDEGKQADEASRAQEHDSGPGYRRDGASGGPGGDAGLTAGSGHSAGGTGVDRSGRDGLNGSVDGNGTAARKDADDRARRAGWLEGSACRPAMDRLGRGWSEEGLSALREAITEDAARDRPAAAALGGMYLADLLAGRRLTSEAVAAYTAALEQAERGECPTIRADLLTKLAACLLDTGRRGEAIEALVAAQAAEKSLGEPGRPRAQAAIARQLGEVHLAGDDPAEAVAPLRQAAQLYMQTGPAEQQAETLTLLGAALHDTDRPDEGKGYLQQAIDCARGAELYRPEADARQNLALLLFVQGARRDGIAELERAIALYNQLGRTDRAAEAYANAGNLHMVRGHSATALSLLQRAAEAFGQSGQTDRLAATLSSVGMLLLTRRQPARAAETLRQALEAAGQADPSLRADVRRRLSVVLMQTGELAEAQAQLEAALGEYGRADDEASKAVAMQQLGMLLVTGGNGSDAARAEQLLRASAELAQRHSDHDTHCDAAQMLAHLHLTRDQTEAARSWAQTALTAAEALGEGQKVARTLRDLGVVEITAGRARQAVDYIRRAVEYYAKAGPADELAESLRDLGVAWAHSGDFAQAEQYLTEATDLAKSESLEECLLDCRIQMANVYQARGWADRALSAWQEALALAERMGDREQAEALRAHLGQIDS
jgi:tetratricopeptide (TPR) repeat protein